MRLPALPTGVAILTLLAAACAEPTSDAIARWKTTEKGPGKLRAAVEKKGLVPRLRGEAAAALWDMGRADEVQTVLGALPAGERWEIMKTLVPLWGEAGKTGGPDKARDARDGLFFLRGSAPPEERGQIDAVLLPAVEAELRAGRLTGGRHSIDKIVAAIGPPAAPLLLKVLGEGTPASAAVAEMLGKVGDEAARDRGAAIVVARAEKESPVAPATWRALAAVGGKAAVDFLGRKMETGKLAEALEAAKAAQQTRQPALLPVALKLAASPATRGELRDEMFGVVQAIGGARARDGMVKIIAGDKNQTVRFLAFETAVSADKADAIVPALEAFPPAASFKKEDVLDLLVRPIERDVGPAARPALVRALGSPSALARMTAVLSLEKVGVGSPAEAEAVARLSSDPGTVKGFPAGDTVGTEADRVAPVVRSRQK